MKVLIGFLLLSSCLLYNAYARQISESYDDGQMKVICYCEYIVCWWDFLLENLTHAIIFKLFAFQLPTGLGIEVKEESIYQKILMESYAHTLFTLLLCWMRRP